MFVTKNIIHLIGWMNFCFVVYLKKGVEHFFKQMADLFLFRDVQPLHQICPTFAPNVWFQTCLTFLNCDYSASFVHTSWTPVGLVMERRHSTGKTIRLKCFEIIGGRSFSFVFTHHSPVMFRLKKVAQSLGNHLDKNNPKQVLTEKMKTASPSIQKSTNNFWKCKCSSTENCHALVLYEKVFRLRKPTPKLQKELEHIGMIHEMLI